MVVVGTRDDGNGCSVSRLLLAHTRWTQFRRAAMDDKAVAAAALRKSRNAGLLATILLVRPRCRLKHGLVYARAQVARTVYSQRYCDTAVKRTASRSKCMIKFESSKPRLNERSSLNVYETAMVWVSLCHTSLMSVAYLVELNRSTAFATSGEDRWATLHRHIPRTAAALE